MTAVILHGTHAATLTHGKRPSLIYTGDYQAAHGAPLSVNLPVGVTSHSGKTVRNCLLNLLPDDLNVIRFLRSEYDLPHMDPLHLLATPIGLDCAGAVQFCADDRIAAVLSMPSGEHPVDEDGIAEWLRRFPVRPAHLDGDHPDTGFSLAGMQPKIALRRQPDGQWTRPWGRLPTTHILKAERRDNFPGECLFEHIALDTASRLGIAAAATEVTEHDGLQVLVVERYDRTPDGLQRIHQEDLCQATDKPPNQKYEYDRGPSVADAAAVMAVADDGTTQRNLSRLRDQLLYSWLIASNDGHAKNYSILHAGPGNHVLAPLYDACSWLPYRGSRPISKIKMAMSLGSGFNLRTCDKPEMFGILAQRLGLRTTDVAARASEMAADLPQAVTGVVEDLPDVRYDAESVEWHLADIAARSAACEQIAEAARTHALTKTAHRRPGGTPHDTRTNEADLRTAAPSREHSSKARTTGPVMCGQSLRGGRKCQRRLVNAPCPIKGHRSSPGSRLVRERQRQELKQQVPDSVGDLL